jgi:hypothetical protein
MASPNGGYYTSLLSQNYQDEWDEDDHLEVANEDIEVLPMSGINTESKNKGRPKNFSEEETICLFLLGSMLDKIQLMKTSKKCNFLGTSREVLS